MGEQGKARVRKKLNLQEESTIETEAQNCWKARKDCNEGTNEDEDKYIRKEKEGQSFCVGTEKRDSRPE